MRIVGDVLLICTGLFLFALQGFGAEPDLDQMTLVRKARLSSASWGATFLEDTDNNYTWQPETLSYSDALTGNEVWVLVRQPNQQDVFSKEHGSNVWSCDGSRVGFFDFSTRTTANPAIRNDRSLTRWIVNADGSGLRATEGYGKYTIGFEGYSWASTELAYYAFGSHATIDAPTYSLCKMTPDSANTVTGDIILDTSSIDTTFKDIVKDGVSNDDSRIVFRSMTDQTKEGCAFMDSRAVYFATLSPVAQVTSYWQASVSIDDYPGHTFEERFHDIWGPGILGDMVVGDYSGNSDLFARFSATGSCDIGDGNGLIYEPWDGDSFGNNDVMVISDGGPEIDNPYGLPYFGHPTFDRWGRYVLMGTYTDTPAPGTRILDMDTMAFLPNYPLAEDQYDGQHHSWGGWTDYVMGVDPASMVIYANTYHADDDNAIAVVDTHHPGRMVNNYNGYPRPSQSPDGTKVAYAAIWLNTGDDSYPHIHWAVVHYPFPPEITQVNSTNNTVTVRFDWQNTLSDDQPRTYTKRGWPHEETSQRPIPRETKLFRLWRSEDASEWTPVNTVDADAFTRFDFANGGFRAGQQSYWEILDTPPRAGLWYYAVTSVEHSGIESRTLSNVFVITVSDNTTSGSSHQNYPADPGGMLNFYTRTPDSPVSVTYAHKILATHDNGQYTLTWSAPEDSSLVRYYNIYARDGEDPLAIKQNRIASIPATAGTNGAFRWVDWLGNSDGSTRYKVTAVDFQGNESNDTIDPDDSSTDEPGDSAGDTIPADPEDGKAGCLIESLLIH